MFWPTLILFAVLVAAFRCETSVWTGEREDEPMKPFEEVVMVDTIDEASKDPQLIQYGECCLIGKKQAAHKSHCLRPHFEQTLLLVYQSQIKRKDWENCIMWAEFCCMEQIIMQECQNGIKLAKKLISSLDNKDDVTECSLLMNNQAYHCCTACKLSISMMMITNDDELNSGPKQRCSATSLHMILRNHSHYDGGGGLIVSSHTEKAYLECCNNHNELAPEDNPQLDEVTFAKQRSIASVCEDGFEYDATGKKCIDIDECKQLLHNCKKPNEYCINTLGSFICSRCPPGYKLQEPFQVCLDVNECEEVPYPCLPEQTCMNSIGSFRCFCQTGFVMDDITGQCKDINECQLGTHNCHETLRCDNTIGSFHCVRVQDCGTGYTINADHDVCEDVDECVLGLHDCGIDYKCHNTQGSFKCSRIHCPVGQRLVQGVCHAVKCDTDHWYNATIGQCVPVNHCQSNPCRYTERCILTEGGGFTCQPLCSPGFEFDHKSNKCEDVDECTTGIAECGLNQRCHNLFGHYDCLCQPGFVMNATRHCEDINECIEQHWRCPHPFLCINTIGSYRCDQCKIGYALDQNGQCQDVNECNDEHLRSNCQHYCHNTDGGYQCKCWTGYKLAADGKKCIDIDECAVMKSGNWTGAKCPSLCINTLGSYKCTCPTGFRSIPGGKGFHCEDINECIDDGKVYCTNSAETCINLLGGYRCETINCPSNFRKTTSYKSIKCILKGERTTRKLDEFDKYEYLYYSLYANETAKYSKGYIIYANRFAVDPQSDNYATKSQGTWFDLRLISSKPDIIEQKKYFNLNRRLPNEVVITLIQPLDGPRQIVLELVIIGIRKQKHIYHKVTLTIDVSQYEAL